MNIFQVIVNKELLNLKIKMAAIALFSVAH